MSVNGHLSSLENRIKDRDLTIGVIGLGYVGLPTAISFHEAGFSVIGIDISESLLESIRDGSSTISNEAGLTIPNDQKWRITSNFQKFIPECDIAIVCAPTPVNSDFEPNLDSVISAFKSVIESKNIGDELILILESTVNPGATMHCIAESIGDKDHSSMGISLAYCPERVSPGEGGKGVGEVARVIGADSFELAVVLGKLYSLISSEPVSPVKSIEVAEASKLVENAQRDIDIAFVNELAIVLPKMGLDVEDVLEAASTKWNFHRHTPGMGVGGHCIPVDPHYYIEFAKKMGTSSALSPAARELNSSMPKHNAKEVFKHCDGDIGRLLLMGFSYKPDVSDARETPVLPFIEATLELGVEDLFVWEPLIGRDILPDSVIPIDDPYGQENMDCIVIGTAHKEVVSLDWSRMLTIMRNPRIYDSRRCLDPKTMSSIGWNYHAIGIPFENH